MAVQAQFFPDSFGLQTDIACFDFQQSLQQQNLFLHLPPVYGFDHCNRDTDASSSSYNSFFHAHQHLEMQQEELDCFLRSQAEGLKRAVQEQTRQQVAALLKRMECESIYAMKQKEEELIQARNRSLELEACVRKAQRESESWQVMAKENEAMAANLSKKIEQVRESLAMNVDDCQDSESIWCGSWHEEERMKKKKKKIACKGCKCRESCLVFLPCRHLCSCKFCEAFFVSCPVCECSREGSIEVFFGPN